VKKPKTKEEIEALVAKIYDLNGLSESAAALTESLVDVEEAFRALQLNVSAEIVLTQEPGETQWLVYGKWKRKWCLYTEWEEDGVLRDRVPLADTSLETRMQAARILPEFFEVWVETAHTRVQEVREATEKVREFVRFLGGEASGSA
jgi:hypothetical protein